MLKRSSTCLASALVGVVLLAGCGGGGSGSSSTGTTGSTPTTGSTATSGSGAANSAAIKQLAVRTCQRTIASQLSLTSTTKARLEAICSKAATGDLSTVRKVSQEVCVEILKSSGGLSGAEKEKAIAACKSSK